MKNLACMSCIFSLLFFSAPAVWGVKEAIEFTGDLETLKASVKRIEELPQTSDEAGCTIGVTVRLSAEGADALDAFFDEVKKIKRSVETVKVTRSPARVANYLISAMQDEGGFQKLIELDLSENESSSGAPVTFIGLEGLLEKTSLQTLSLANNHLSETMDLVLRGIFSSQNQLTKLDLSQTNPTPQTMSSLVHPLMSRWSPPFSLVLNGNLFGEGHMSIIASLMSTANPTALRLDDLYLQKCQVPSSSLTDVVRYYLIQGSCRHLFCDDESEGNPVSHVLLKPIIDTLDLLKNYESVQNILRAPTDPLERLKTLCEDNPGFRASLNSSFLLHVDELLDELAGAETSDQRKKDQSPQGKWGLKKYFTDLF